MGGSSTHCQPAVAKPEFTARWECQLPGMFPGARYNAVSWTDSEGNLWLFGGSGFDANGNGADLNDLWKFNPSTNEWAWMGGGSTALAPRSVRHIGRTCCGKRTWRPL